VRAALLLLLGVAPLAAQSAPATGAPPSIRAIDAARDALDQAAAVPDMAAGPPPAA
jgi:hypothetical protein